ncbi:glycoside hydrolase family 15 protein [Tundrisphaera lichenicola]|uniref:glycoside hydrolase family 15 protein n=1 Tax=Tundrisphaera lichenicola TaxID=2029860 RepID=UPI003EC10633
MPSRIEDYALIGDCLTTALVAKDGSIDWLCLPWFDSSACFAALLGGPENGRWRIAPVGEVISTRRRYRGDTLVLETEYETAEGTVRLIDFMPPRSEAPDLIRIVEGVSGRVPMHLELILRFDYGSIVPWVRRVDGGITATAGPDLTRVIAGTQLHGKDMTTVADFTVSAGERVSFDLTYYRSYGPEPDRVDPELTLLDTEDWWRDWASRCRYQGRWRDVVLRSLITLKALTYAPSGGIVAAPTTSLPEAIGGVRNWDYRICWVRDAAFTLFALANAGYLDEAKAWRGWLQRAIAGTPETLQIMYGIDGRRRLDEWELPWLGGYEGSRPVRVGNAASNQFQLDVFGELAATMYECRKAGLEVTKDGWAVGLSLYTSLERVWREPDEGIWEIRGPRRHFTHSKVMAWVAFDRAIRSIEELGVEGPLDRWRGVRDEIHAEVCREGFDADRGAFVQSYGSKELDASLLMIPLYGFLPASDPRVRSTIEAIERELTVDGLVQRYDTTKAPDGLPPGEGTFLPCSFWLVDCLHLLGREADARELFERLVGLCNDVGLIAEEYDPHLGRMTGNFPQAFTHVALINSAFHLSGHRGPTDGEGVA